MATAVQRCDLMVAARSLAASNGPKGRAVTPSGALTPAEVPAAAQAMGLVVQLPVRRAADVPQVHRGWLMAVGTGMVKLASRRAFSADAPAVPGDDVDVVGADAGDQVLAGWMRGLLLICSDASGRRHPQTLQWLVMLTLEMLDGSEWSYPSRTYRHSGHALDVGVRHALAQDHGLDRMVDMIKVRTWLALPADGDEGRLIALLTEAGAVRGTPESPEVTAAGRWLAARLREQAPVRIAPDWPAERVLTQLATTTESDAELLLLTDDWFRAREPVEAVRQLLGAAVDTDMATRAIAVRLVAFYGEHGLPVWREFLDDDRLGVHARRELSWWTGEGPPLGEEDKAWLAVEWAGAALASADADEALSLLADSADGARGDRPDAQQLLASVRASGHPESEQVTAALTDFLASAAPRAIEHQLEVTVRLNRWRPPTWRRVLVPATMDLGDLHWTISVLFGWSMDHLHVFEIGPRTLTDPGYDLGDAEDEEEARLSRLFATGARTFDYTFDLGARWEHQIVLERLVPIDPGLPLRRCVAYAGDSPLEYPQVEDEYGDPIASPVMTRPFDLDKVNATFASGYYVVDDDGEQDDDIEDEAR